MKFSIMTSSCVAINILLFSFLGSCVALVSTMPKIAMKSSTSNTQAVHMTTTPKDGEQETTKVSREEITCVTKSRLVICELGISLVLHFLDSHFVTPPDNSLMSDVGCRSVPRKSQLCLEIRFLRSGSP